MLKTRKEELCCGRRMKKREMSMVRGGVKEHLEHVLGQEALHEIGGNRGHSGGGVVWTML